MSTSRYSRDSYTTPPPRDIVDIPGAPRHNARFEMTNDTQVISMHPNFFMDMQPKKAQSMSHGLMPASSSGHSLMPAFDINLPLTPPSTPPTRHEFTLSQAHTDAPRQSTPMPLMTPPSPRRSPITPPSPRRSPRKSLKRMHSDDSSSSSSTPWTKAAHTVITRSRAKLHRTISLPKDSSPYHIKQGLHSPSLVAIHEGMSRRLGMGW